jgi:hypothetical protein
VNCHHLSQQVQLLSLANNLPLIVFVSILHFVVAFSSLTRLVFFAIKKMLFHEVNFITLTKNINNSMPVSFLSLFYVDLFSFVLEAISFIFFFFYWNQPVLKEINVKFFAYENNGLPLTGPEPMQPAHLRFNTLATQLPRHSFL